MKTQLMKLTLAAMCAASLITASSTASAQDFASTSHHNWEVSVGWVGLKYGGSDASSAHSTHPDDRSFLGSGSAGETDLSDELLNFGSIGFRYLWQPSGNFNFNAGANWMMGNARDEKQNVNDPRPEQKGAFIYSALSTAADVGVGFSYKIPNVPGLSVGVDGRAMFLFISHGWDRWGSDEEVSSDTKCIPMVCPNIQYKFNESWGLRASALIGPDTIGGALSFTVSF
jgi:hypothetical protein